MKTARYLASLIFLGHLTGCSFLLNWDISGLECAGATETCRSNHSCLAGKCIANATRSLGQTCERDVQCTNGNKCPAGICATACDATKTFLSSPVCPAGQYCAPFLSTSRFTDANYHDPELVTVCVAGATCTPGQSCTQAAGGVCTVITGEGGGTNACVVSCEQQFAGGTTYSDNCGLDTNGEALYCTPVGEKGYQELACLNAGKAPLPAGEACNTSFAPCVPGAGCINNVCRTYCQPGGKLGCPTGQSCCSYVLHSSTETSNLGNPVTGYCLDATATCSP